MNTKINKVDCDWINIKNKCRTTVNKQYTENVPTQDFKEKLLFSEHSPIRLLNVDWSWKDIKYWVSTELSRHKFEKFISTQRTDRTGVSRDELPQAKLVNYDGYANAQNLIDMSRKRLCFCATNEARTLVEELKLELIRDCPELAKVLVPNCVYRCGCPEFKSCGFWEKFSKDLTLEEISNIKSRYEKYNTYFVKQKLNAKYGKCNEVVNSDDNS